MWLVALTGILALAVIVLTGLTLYRARVERQHSDARVAALAAAIDDPHWAQRAANDWSPRVEEQEHYDLPETSPRAVSFVVPDVKRPGRAPAFAVGTVIILAMGGLLLTGLNGGGRSHRSAVAAITPSIELLSMRHARDGETLIVSGLVRNPSMSATPTLSAVISVVGRDGQVVARGESRLDSDVLGPGKETTFRVAVAEVSDPGRYRVAFVNGSQIVPHVDRRSDLSRTALANEAHGN
jgi:hypothetical protein